jgi:hypothetical protein
VNFLVAAALLCDPARLYRQGQRAIRREAMALHGAYGMQGGPVAGVGCLWTDGDLPLPLPHPGVPLLSQMRVEYDPNLPVFK